MALHYPDKEPLSQRIQEMMNQQAAAKEMFRNMEKKSNKNKILKEITSLKMKVLLSVCFAVFYFISVIITTYLVQQDYEERLVSHLEIAERMVSANVTEDVRAGVNSLYDIKDVQNQHQYFAAEIYNVDGEKLVTTEPCLRFRFLEADEEPYYFPMEEYFDDSEIWELLLYARNTTEEYMIRAEIAKESEVLASLKFIYQGITESKVVWEWHNEEIAYDKIETSVYSQRAVIKEIVHAVSYNKDIYETWLEEEFLHGFKETVNEEERSVMEDAMSGIWQTRLGGIRRVTCENIQGEEETYWLSIRSIGYPLRGAIELLAPFYVAGLILTCGSIYIVVYMVKRFNRK